MNAGFIVFLVLVILAFFGLPIYMAICAGTMIAMMAGGFPLEALPQKVFLGLNSVSLLSIPLFILAGNLMAKGITQKLIDVANALLGTVRGALGAITIVASAFFGAITGSAVACVAAIGGMMIPAMEKEGYDKDYAVALSSCASLLGPLVPPAIPLIIYASLTDVSVQKLFIATISSALFCGGGFLIYALWYGKKHNLPKYERKSAKEVGHTIKESIWALLLPVIVLGLIFSGITTVNEAAAISCVYAIVVTLFVYKSMNFKSFLNVMYKSAIAVSTCMILVGMSKASSFVVISAQLPQEFMHIMSSITNSKVIVLIVINIIFLILGCLMDGTSIIVMMVPLMLALVQSYNINLIQFGIMVAVNTYLGCITPPVGVSLLLGTKLGNTSMGSSFKACLPFLAIGLLTLILVTYWPTFTLFAVGQ